MKSSRLLNPHVTRLCSSVGQLITSIKHSYSTMECSVCVENKKPREMATRVTPTCEHKPTVCKECLQGWLASSIATALVCPDCSEPLGWADAKRHLSKRAFARYDDLLLRTALSQIPDFQYCLSPKCTSGQIRDDKSPRFDCVACGNMYCVHHQVPWHTGRTCEQYDHQHRKHRRAEVASGNEIHRTTRACPGCSRRVSKISGCNHMTCKSPLAAVPKPQQQHNTTTASHNTPTTNTPLGICGQQWCYGCLAPYDGHRSCFHGPDCSDASRARGGLPVDPPPPAAVTVRRELPVDPPPPAARHHHDQPYQYLGTPPAPLRIVRGRLVPHLPRLVIPQRIGPAIAAVGCPPPPPCT